MPPITTPHGIETADESVGAGPPLLHISSAELVILQRLQAAMPVE